MAAVTVKVIITRLLSFSGFLSVEISSIINADIYIEAYGVRAFQITHAIHDIII